METNKRVTRQGRFEQGHAITGSTHVRKVDQSTESPIKFYKEVSKRPDVKIILEKLAKL